MSDKKYDYAHTFTTNQGMTAINGGLRDGKGKVLIPAIPGTKIRVNGDGTFDRLYEDGRVERVQIQENQESPDGDRQ